MRHHGFRIGAIVLLAAHPVFGQSPATRQQALEREREAKATHVQPYVAGWLERLLVTLDNDRLLDRLFNPEEGIYARVGTITPGSSFSFGPAYRKPGLLNGEAQFSAFAQGSFTQYWIAEGRLAMPRVGGSALFVELYWLNHDDSRGLNTLDMLEGPTGHHYIRHYMFDFGSTLGSGSFMAQARRAGNEYILEWAPALHARHAGVARASVDHRGLSRRAPICGTIRGGVLRSPSLETRVPEPRLRQYAAGGRLLGRPHRGQIFGRGDSGGRGESPLQRGRGRGLHHRGVDHAQGQGPEDVAHRRQSDRRRGAGSLRCADVRQRGRRRRRGGAARLLRARLVTVR